MNIKIFTCFIFLSFGAIQTIHSVESDFYSIVETARLNPAPIAYAVQLQREDVVKFLIDRNENVNQSTPSSPVYHDFGDYSVNMFRLPNDEPGQTPLEIAIRQKNSEMIKILTTYHPTNRANPEYGIFRYTYLSSYGGGDLEAGSQDRYYSSPLVVVLSTEEPELVDLVLKAFQTPETLFNEYYTIRGQNNPLYMRSWMESNIKLWAQTKKEVSDDSIAHFHTHTFDEAITQNDLDSLRIFHENAWLISKEQFESILATENMDAIQLTLDQGRFNPNFSPEEKLLEHGLESLIETSFLLNMVPSIATLDRVDLLERIYPELKENEVKKCGIIASENGSVQVLQFLVSQNANLEGALLAAVKKHQVESFTLLMQLPISDIEMNEAINSAYTLHYYDLLEVMLSIK